MHEADELLEKIINLIESEGCEVVRKDTRKKEHGANWTMDMKLFIKPTSGEEL